MGGWESALDFVAGCVKCATHNSTCKMNCLLLLLLDAVTISQPLLVLSQSLYSSYRVLAFHFGRNQLKLVKWVCYVLNVVLAQTRKQRKIFKWKMTGKWFFLSIQFSASNFPDFSTNFLGLIAKHPFARPAS